MSGRIDPSKWIERQEWVRQQQASGLSVAEFCREHGLHIGNFYAWKHKLAGELKGQSQSVAGKSGTGKSGAGKSGTGGKSFAGKSVAGDRAMRAFVQVPLPLANGATGSPWIEISLADGTVVRVPASNLAALKLVLSTLNPSVREAWHA